ncbi:DsbA family protein [Nocardia donostiensis]|nr:thioredoxin domain-containing protein [Nocardia donostiensis]
MSTSPSNYTPRPMSSTTTYALGAVALVMIGLIVVLAYRWGTGEAEVRNDGYGSVRQDAVVSALHTDGAIRLGRTDAAKTIDLYEDPLCPACGSLEHLYGQEIAQKMDEGKLAVRYRFVNFLDPRSESKDYSTRAIAALQCVASAGSGPTYAKFHHALFTDRQPEEGGADLSNNDLAALAAEVGAPEPAHQCITSGERIAAAKTDAAAATDDLTAALDDNAATPSVFDGETRLDVNNQEWVAHAAP